MNGTLDFEEFRQLYLQRLLPMIEEYLRRQTAGAKANDEITGDPTEAEAEKAVAAMLVAQEDESQVNTTPASDNHSSSREPAEPEFARLAANTRRRRQSRDRSATTEVGQPSFNEKQGSAVATETNIEFDNSKS